MNARVLILLAAGAIAPVPVFAQSLASLTDSIVTFVNTTLVPAIYALAFLIFLVGMVRFFFLEQSDQARARGKQLMLWGIIGFVVMFSVWGLVNLLLASFGVRA